MATPRTGRRTIARRCGPTSAWCTQTRTGKGNALACGFAAATGDIIVMIDADGSTDPAEIPRFVAALTSGADFAKGTRFSPAPAPAAVTSPRCARLGNRMLGVIVNAMFGTRYSDLCYGYNAFWAMHVPVFDLERLTPLRQSAALG